MFRHTSRVELSLQLTSIRPVTDYLKLKWNIAACEFANQRNKIHHPFLLLNNPAHVTDRQRTLKVAFLAQLMQSHWLNAIGNVPRAFSGYATVPNNLLMNRFANADRTINERMIMLQWLIESTDVVVGDRERCDGTIEQRQRQPANIRRR